MDYIFEPNSFDTMKIKGNVFFKSILDNETEENNSKEEIEFNNISYEDDRIERERIGGR